MTQRHDTPKLGELIPEGDQAFRDAVHVAVAPVVAGEELTVGERVTVKNGLAFSTTAGDDCHGVVDPFLSGAGVAPGQRFWLLVVPNTIASLRHAWTAPWSSELTVKKE